MEKKYCSKHMRKVYFMGEELQEAFFPDQASAEVFIQAMKEKGVTATMNTWTWEVLVEQ